ncbi:MAG: efflux RND transporter periplasmic adaptor subunit [Emcibacteraceae bacterium]|nr:efflux RND transporter periplasmic adaptor subunit [Emcibacteraceae bacterium]
MTYQKVRTLFSFVLLMINTSIITNAQENNKEEIEVSLTTEQIKSAGITTKKLTLSTIEESLKTTGEVISNAYSSSLVTPRIPSIVIARHTKLGENVEKGQMLVTLFSVEMASTQSLFINVSQEWDRIRKLSKDIITVKRYNQAETEYRKILAQLKAYGMSDADIDTLYKSGDLQTPGEYELYALQSGTIASDNFLIGALIEPGTVLFKLIDEQSVWIESAIPSSQFDTAFKATRAIIRLDDFHGSAQIISAAEVVDEATRRRNIRLSIDNKDHKLHPGQFVNVEFLIPSNEQGIVVPKTAVLRSADGDWMIFTQDEDGGFLPREIEVLKSAGDQHIISGVDVGKNIVIGGAFFVQSELAKSGFNIHNH